MESVARKRWEAPRMEPHGLGALNKFGRRPGASEIAGAIEGASVEALVEAYGSPLFVTSERRLRDNVRRLRQVFETRWPDFVHGWSYKTNYSQAVCAILHQEGSIAEVVSGFEYSMARANGVDGRDILFNGPAKRRPDLERAVAEGAAVHVDHFDELALVADVAATARRRVRVAPRLTFETGFAEPWSRFGFHVESGRAEEAIRRMADDPWLDLVGLHSHLGTFVADPAAYAAQARMLCRTMRQAEAIAGRPLDYLDIGGGFPSANALQGVYLAPEAGVPPLDAFAAAICDELAAGCALRTARGLRPPRLICEAGRAVVDDAQHLIATVVGGKDLPDGRRAAILDAGVNLLFTGFWYDHPVRPTRPLVGAPVETVLYGPLCMNIDVVRRGVQLPPLAPGDRLVVGCTGAYNNTQWMQFIERRPAVALLHLGGGHSLIRAAEDLDDVRRPERLPPHLARVTPLPGVRAA